MSYYIGQGNLSTEFLATIKGLGKYSSLVLQDAWTWIGKDVVLPCNPGMSTIVYFFLKKKKSTFN